MGRIFKEKGLNEKSRFVLLKNYLKNTGQVTVEMLLMLPVFFLLLFCVMEVGNIAFQIIIANHGAYELARIGSLTAGPPDGSLIAATGRMEMAKSNMFPNPEDVSLLAGTEITGLDPESVGHINSDLVLTLRYNANLVFPIAQTLLAKPFGSGKFLIETTVRMPIESPLY